LDYHQRLLFYGAPVEASIAPAAAAAFTGSTVGLSRGVSAALTNGVIANGCEFIARFGTWPPSSSVQPVEDSVCRAFAAGLVGRGLLGCLDDLVATSRALCSKRGDAVVLDAATGAGVFPTPTGDTVPYIVSEVLVSADMARITGVTTLFLTPAFDGLALVYAQAASALLAGQQLFLICFLAAAVSVFGLYMLGFYLPAVRRVSTEAKQQRLLLLLVPAPLLQHLPGLHAAVDDLIGTGRRAHGAGGSHV
jgi:hypothetical protein